MTEKKTVRTVRDFKEHLLKVAGVTSHFEFNKRSDVHMNF